MFEYNDKLVKFIKYDDIIFINNSLYMFGDFQIIHYRNELTKIGQHFYIIAMILIELYIVPCLKYLFSKV
jgi:hypothetical protein